MAEYIKLDGNGFAPDAELVLGAERDEDKFLTFDVMVEHEDGSIESTEYIITEAEAPRFFAEVEQVKTKFERL